MELDELRRAMEGQEATWEAGETALSNRPVTAGDLEMLGYVPGPAEPSLEEQERLARENFLTFSGADGDYPARHDWREVDGGNFITPVKDQGNCGSCVAFGASAAVEGTLRAERRDPGLEVDLSEAFLFYCVARSQGRRCFGREEGGWWPHAALEALQGEGVPDEASYPYTAGDQECSSLAPDWQDRATQIGAWREITDPLEMRRWIATRGPVVGTMSVYEDFVRFYKGGVYRYISGAPGGGHCICIVGYDDDAQCWIGKNSWGTGWGEDGFFRIAYGEVGIDSAMFGVEGVVPPA